MTRRIRRQSGHFGCGAGSDRRLRRRVFSHQQMAIAPPDVTMTVFKKKKEKKNKLPFRKTLGKQFGRSRPRRLPPTLADLMRRAKPLKKASHLAAAAHTPTSTIPIGRVLRRSPNAAACFGNQNVHQVNSRGAKCAIKCFFLSQL